MKSYKIIEMKEFDRADYFRYFTSVGTTIEFTIKIDVTTAVQKCYQESISFHAYTVFKIYKVMNSIQIFDMIFLMEMLLNGKSYSNIL